ncbi:myeloperoxidase-like [Engystomops pustulosus]|uniref:myeloperoxidase-like n=1 Tax=Engystomops pustulosus TaxID=76066 RepID=UPI003AFB3ADA
MRKQFVKKEKHLKEEVQKREKEVQITDQKRHCESGLPSKGLIQKIKKQQELTRILAIKDSFGEVEIQEYLGKIQFPVLGREERDVLSHTNTAVELETVASCKGNVSPGLDGLPLEIYKGFALSAASLETHLEKKFIVSSTEHGEKMCLRMNSEPIYAVLLLAGLLIPTASSQDGVEELNNEFIESCAKEAKNLVDTAYKNTRQILKERLRKKNVDARDLMAYFKQPVAGSRNAIRAADYMGTTLQLLEGKVKYFYDHPFNITDLLTKNQINSISKFSGCATQHLPKACQEIPYRSITGECNNRRNPSLGASNTGFTRLLRAQYEDGVSLPRGWTESRRINGFRLPLARQVSNEIVRFLTENITLDNGRALIFMQWGQWTDHDLDLSPETPARATFLEGIDCDTSCAREPPCFPLKIPPNDPRFTNRSDCIPLFRSSPVCNPESPIREQINILTSFLDGSQVYGSDLPLAFALRNNTNQFGLMAINQNFTDNGREYLPFETAEEDFCVLTNRSSGIPCFLGGDPRVSEHPGLTAFHTLFVREHNRIATALRRLNPRMTGETLYQEARKIVGAILQKITYKDWLPLLLGSQMPRVLPNYRGYNESVDPRVANVFTVVSQEPTTPLHMTFFNSWRVARQGGIDPLLRGLMANRAKLNRQNQLVVDELRERLFKLFKRTGLDLPAINLQRGREHGIPGYNAWRRFCGLSAPRNLNELAAVLNNRELAQKFINLYGTPENIDIWVGGVAEPSVRNGRIGELLTCLIGNQFRRARDGDRFYYENRGVLTSAQKNAIERVSFARVICENTGITEVPQNVFLANQYPRDFRRCSTIPALDLGPWRQG